MKSFSKSVVRAVASVVCVVGTCAVAVAGAHTWEPWIVYSNADGTVQFVALKEAHGGPGEVNIGNFSMVALPSNNSRPLHNVAGNTASRYYLLGTTAFAALLGAPPLDDVIPSNFINVATDNGLRYTYSMKVDATWTAGTVPTNGIDMLTRTESLSAMVSRSNVATNYAGMTGCVDASGAAPVLLPGVPDGGASGGAMRVGKLTPDGSSLSINWDSVTCTDTNDHHIVYGQKSGLPAKRGGLYTVLGAACGIGSATPYTWTPTPNAVDVHGLTWFLVVTTDGAGTEGPWGDNGVNDRNGSGAGCSSGFCGTTKKSLAGTCGL